MINLVIPRSVLESHIFASTDGTRCAIQHVALERVKDNMGINVIATDGHRMNVLRIEGTLDVLLLVPAELLKDALKGAKKDSVFQLVADDKKITLVRDGTAELVAPNRTHEYTFPAWEQVMPDKTKPNNPAKEFGIDTDYLADLAKYLKKVGNVTSCVRIVVRGDRDPVVFEPTQLDTSVGVSLEHVIMPVRL